MQNNKCTIAILFSSVLLASCVSGGGGSTPIPAPTPAAPMPYTTVYSAFNSGSPLTGSANSVQNSINPNTNTPLFQLNSLNYGNTALSLNNNVWSISFFGNGTTTAQNLVMDNNGNVDQSGNGVLTVFNPSTWAVINSYSFDDTISLTYAVINPAGETILGYSSTGAYSCPVNGGPGTCTLLSSLSSYPKRIQYVNNNLYAIFVESSGVNTLSAINTMSSLYTQYSLNIPTPFQIDEFVPDPSDVNSIYFIALKSSNLYMSIFNCNLNESSCTDVYDNIISTTNVYSEISADSNYLYFMHTQINYPTIEYSIAQVNK